MADTKQPPGGLARNADDWTQIRHGQDTHRGIAPGRFLQPAPMLFRRDGHTMFLGDIFRGRAAFLICGGPSLLSHDLTKLSERGILTCAVNNAATVVRPNLWVSVDDPSHFSDVIWRDPGIWKFVPLCHMEKSIWQRNGSGDLEPGSERVGEMPAVFGYRRNEHFVAEQWLYEDSFNWGNHGNLVDAHDVKGSRSVMLVALRMLFFLGVRTVYLVGCDFRMASGQANYAFEQDRSTGSIVGNNQTYQALNVRLKALQPYFEREGFEVVNCTPASGLTVFPFLKYDQAIAKVTADLPARIITRDMYDRGANAKPAAKRVEKGGTVAPVVDTKRGSEGTEDDPSLPGLTLVTYADAATADQLLRNWRSWMRYRPPLRGLRKIVLVDRGEPIDDELQRFLQKQPQVRIVPVEAGPADWGRDRWTRPLFRDVARLVKTPWYLTLEPSAIATAPSPLWLADWLAPDDQGRSISFIASPWGYTKPADAIEALDRWADSVPGLRESPQLQLEYDSASDRIRHETISSWCFFGDTNWTKEVGSYLRHRSPRVAHDTLAYYLARRRGEGFRRVKLKDYGWNHSFVIV